jgi:multidrug resistance efflux pump
MKKISKKVMGIIAGILVVACGVVFYFYYQDTHILSTDNAQVTANTITITPLLTGNVAFWNVKEGDVVKKDQVLGRQDLSQMQSSSSINVSALNSSADSILSKADIKSPIDWNAGCNCGRYHKYVHKRKH